MDVTNQKPAEKGYLLGCGTLLIIFVLVIALGVLWSKGYLAYIFSKEARLMYSGYCPELGRALTDQEKCDIAVMAIINDKNSYIDYPYINEEGERLPYKKIIKKYDYSSLDEFYAMNPNSCEFVKKVWIPDGPWYKIPFKEKISGRWNTLIEVTYIFAYDTQNNNEPIQGGQTFGLSNCGQLWTDSDLLSLY